MTRITDRWGPALITSAIASAALLAAICARTPDGKAAAALVFALAWRALLMERTHG